ncbi:hypothetical protein INT47_002510 [Mucor saturninus]|uniref:Small ribosomal subunit protein uS2 n=1 Tax=Mucor saturninus TaxID=64648 RepID=A0A8H7RJ35_9FUNG|nr:hypothetical protein INT47_002510 [Mucor saturninus]
MTDIKSPPNPTDEDIRLLLAAKCHLGSKNINNHMKEYMFSRRQDGIFIIHIGKLWEKLILAARVLATVQTPADIYVTSSSVHGRRPANKLGNFIGATSNLGRFTPGTFTKALVEPEVLVCLDPHVDYQAISESSKCNVPVIAFTNSHSPLEYVDVAIPCNNLGSQSIGLMCWLLARAVIRLRGLLNYKEQWGVMPDMFFYMDEEADRVVQENEDYSGGYDKNQTDGEGTWSGDKDFSTSGYDDGVNWQSEVPKASDGWGDGGNNAPSFTTPTTAFGSSDQLIDMPVFNTNVPVFAEKTPVDWADDVPQEHVEVTMADSTGWDDNITTNQQWKGPTIAPWDA